tara:strand:- start:118 stop:393 length:276 start_codon:yes stop_codon:yes gene_type:complete
MWSQGVLPEWMFPKDIRLIVSVKNWTHGKWLELVDPENKLTDEILEELVKLKVPIKYSRDGKQYIHGGSEFEEFYKDYVKKISNFLPPVSD